MTLGELHDQLQTISNLTQRVAQQQARVDDLTYEIRATETPDLDKVRRLDNQRCYLDRISSQLADLRKVQLKAFP